MLLFIRTLLVIFPVLSPSHLFAHALQEGTDILEHTHSHFPDEGVEKVSVKGKLPHSDKKDMVIKHQPKIEQNTKMLRQSSKSKQKCHNQHEHINQVPDMKQNYPNENKIDPVKQENSVKKEHSESFSPLYKHCNI